MPQIWCEECKNLFDKAAAAILAHSKAIARLADAVRSNFETGLPGLESDVRATRIVHEYSVAQYQDHRARHEARTMTAGSGSFE